MLINNSLELIGNTPLLKLNNLLQFIDYQDNEFYVKCEMYNLTGSIKDRAALTMINEALKQNKINTDGTIIEATSGNTGIGLAAIASIYKLKCIIVMPDSMSIERIKLMELYGAEVVLTNGAEGMSGAIAKAIEINKKTPNSLIISQFDNPHNPLAHYNKTADEIYDDLYGDINYLFAGIGTGGTISGIAQKLKPQIPNLKVIGIEPKDSPIITKGYKGPHKIQGIGAGFIPANLNQNLIDDYITVTNDDAYKYAHLLTATEAILGGISSGAALAGAINYAQKHQLKNQKIVIILPDSGMRYLSDERF